MGMDMYANPARPEALAEHFTQIRQDRPTYLRRWDLLERYVERVRAEGFEAFPSSGGVRIGEPVHRVSPAYANHTGKIDIDLPESSGEQLLTLPFMGRKDPVTEQRVKTTHWWFVNLRVAEDLGNEQEALETAVTLTCRAAEWMRNGRTD